MCRTQWFQIGIFMSGTKQQVGKVVVAGTYSKDRKTLDFQMFEFWEIEGWITWITNCVLPWMGIINTISTIDDLQKRICIKLGGSLGFRPNHSCPNCGCVEFDGRIYHLLSKKIFANTTENTQIHRETYKSKWWEDGWKALVYSHIRSSGWVLPINFKVGEEGGQECTVLYRDGA